MTDVLTVRSSRPFICMLALAIALIGVVLSAAERGRPGRSWRQSAVACRGFMTGRGSAELPDHGRRAGWPVGFMATSLVLAWIAGAPARAPASIHRPGSAVKRRLARGADRDGRQLRRRQPTARRRHDRRYGRQFRRRRDRLTPPSAPVSANHQSIATPCSSRIRSAVIGTADRACRAPRLAP